MDDFTGLKRSLQALANPDIAAGSGRFFKNGPRQYGEEDRFVGIRVPVLCKLAAEFRLLRHSDGIIYTLSQRQRA